MNNEKEAQDFLNQMKSVVKDEFKNVANGYIKITTATVVSVSADGNTATVRLAFAAADGSQDFSVPITTRQIVAAGDAVNIAYWGNLATGMIISKG